MGFAKLNEYRRATIGAMMRFRRRAMPDDERPPEITPWGPKQEEWQDMAGFWWVSTPRHGGIYLTPEQRKDIPDLIKPHGSDAEGIWWEEDCAWSLSIVSLLSQRPRGSLSEEEEYVLEQAHDTARDSFPDEWEQITGREIKQGESYKREEGREIAAIHSDELLAGTIWRSSAENAWVPEGMVGIAAYPGEAFVESNMDPARTHAVRYFLIPEGEVKWRTPPFELNPARHQEVTGREGTPPNQAKEAGQTMSEATHIAVSYKTAGAEVTCINAVSEEISRELERLKEKPRGADLVHWLEDRGCKLDCSSGPAYMRRDADGSTSEGYLRDGKWHREDGPARTLRNADGSAWEQHYFQGGKLHREDGPARVTRKTDGSMEEAYYRDGRLHREDGPAYVRRGSDGSMVREDYRLHGKRVAKDIFEKRAEAELLKPRSPDDERPPEKTPWGDAGHGAMTDEEAAHMTVTYKTPEGDAVTRIYAISEELAREDRKLPFHEFLTGRELNKFLQNRDCRLDCSTGPAVVEHSVDGSTYEEYWRDGRMHRADGPAQIERLDDGEVIRENYYLNGERVAKDIFEKRAEAESLKPRSPDDERPPGTTPWGVKEKPDRLVAGFWLVNASNHGGLYLTEEQRKAIPDSLKAHSTEGTGIWWEWSEENGAWSLPVMCLLSGRPETSLSEEKQMCLYFADQACRDKYPHEWEQLTGRRLKEITDSEPQRERAQSTVAATELTVHTLLEDPWLVLDHPLPEGADPQLLKAARAAAVVCRYEAEDLIRSSPNDPHARNLKKIDAIFTDIRHRLGEPEPEGIKLEPEMKTTLDELEKTWDALRHKERDRER